MAAIRLFRSPDDPALPPIPEPTGRPDPGRAVRNWRPRVGQLVEKYLRYCRDNDVHAPTTAANCKRTLGLFELRYGQRTADTLQAFDLEDFIDANESWSKVGTKRLNASYVKACWRYGLLRGYLPADPFAVVRYKGSPRGPEVTDDLYARMCRAAHKPLEHALKFLRLTGCRQHEARAALWGDVDLRSAVWTVWKHKTVKRTGKPKKKALIPEAVAMLRELLADRPKAKPNDHVLLNSWGRPWADRSLNSAITNLAKKIGLAGKITPHGFRHRFGSAGAQNGAPLKLLAEQMGHENTQTLERYYCDVSDATEAMRVAANLAAPKV